MDGKCKMQHLKKKKYKFKKLPIIILCLLVLAVILSLLIRDAMITEVGGEPISSQENHQGVTSQTSEFEREKSSMIVSEDTGSSKTESSSEPVPSSETSSAPVSSKENPSSATSPKPKPPSSTPPASNQAPTSSAPIESMEETPPTPDGEIPEGSVSDWNLILLNPEEENKIEQELSFQKTKFDTQYVDSRAAQAYTDMYNAAKKEGITLYLRSGYRSMKTQGVNYNANVQRLLKQGLTNDEAIRQTNLYYTVPGHSEHHSGLAFDIITPEYHRDIYTLNEKFAETEAYAWLKANCEEYGFILRYPKEKYDITTINFEPWHYRYVGVEHAKYITENNICFEEYIELLKEVGR